MNKEDIRMNDYYNVLYYMLEQDRSKWKDIISKYITDIDDNDCISINNCTSINATLESFSVDFKGKYNIGDYVTTKNKGGIYRIIGLPYLDIRWKEKYNQWDKDIDTNIGRIEQFGISYTLAGIDDNNKPSGTEYDIYFEDRDEFGINLSLDDCRESNLIMVDPGNEKRLIDSEAGKLFNFLDEEVYE